MAEDRCTDSLGKRPSSLKVFKSVEWMNQKPARNRPYVPTTIEHVANVITHGVWVLPSAYACFHLVSKSRSRVQFWAATVYGVSLVLCFAVSTMFHSVFYQGTNRGLKELLHRGDRAMIYIFIAASYFPWVLLSPIPSSSMWSGHLWWVVWALCVFGITYQQVFYEKYKTIETIIYVIVAIGPSLVVVYNKALDVGAERQLMIGGILYLSGIIFFKADGRIPCAHAIWHLFVVSAAAVHYFAILNHLFL